MPRGSKPGERRGGRKKGTPHKKTVELNMLTRLAPFIDGAEYTSNVKARILRGKAPHMEAYLAQRLHGKPVEKVEMSGPDAKPIKVVIQVVRG